MRRHRVVLRSKVRSQRRHKFLLLLGVGLAGALSFKVARRLQDAPRILQRENRASGSGGDIQVTGLSRFWNRVFKVDRITITGVPARWEPILLQTIDFKPGSSLDSRGPEKLALRLKSQFSCLKEVTPHRNWWKRTVRLQADLHSAVAGLERGGKALSYLSEEGRIFDAPEGIYNKENLPRVDLAKSRTEGLLPLARFLVSSLKPGAFPSPVERVAWSLNGGEWGWEIFLRDGTRVLWGDLNGTQEKLARLKQALENARAGLGGALTADLRFFEDDKILVRSN